MIKKAYAKGFIDKCAEYGVDPNALIKKAGFMNWLRGLFGGNKSNNQESLQSYLNRGMLPKGYTYSMGPNRKPVLTAFPPSLAPEYGLGGGSVADAKERAKNRMEELKFRKELGYPTSQWEASKLHGGI